jgi:hypothetical protein
MYELRICLGSLAKTKTFCRMKSLPVKSVGEDEHDEGKNGQNTKDFISVSTLYVQSTYSCTSSAY